MKLILTALLTLGFCVQGLAQNSLIIECPEAQISITALKALTINQDVEVSMGTDTIFNTRLRNATLNVQDCPDEAQCWTSKISLLPIKNRNQKITVKIENTYNQKVLKPVVEICTIK
jgi:hypothetical protein